MKLDTRSAAMTFLLAAMTAIGPATMDIYLASLPHIGTALDASVLQVQLTLSLYLVGFAIGQIFYGPLSDALGRRPLLLAGFLIYLVATAACAAATSIEMLIAARILQALGAAGPIIIARAMVRDLHSGAQAAKQLGLMSAIQGIAPICAPILGGVLQAGFGWRSNFVALEAVGLVLVAIAYFLLPETNTHRAGKTMVAPRRIFEGMAEVSRDKAYRAYLAMNALAYSAVFAFLSGVSHILQDVYHFTATQFGLTYALCSSSYIAGNAIGSQLVTRLRLEGMLRLGSTIMGVAVVLQILFYAMWPEQFLTLIVPQMLIFFGVAFHVPQVMAAAMTPFPQRAGSASSLIGFSQMITAATVGGVLGAMVTDNAWSMILVGAACCAGIIVILHATTGIRTAAREAARHRDGAAAPVEGFDQTP